MYRKNLKDEYYTRKAREENYPARSIYKLQEINEKFKIFKIGDYVLDLGCAPGSWLMYIAEKVGARGRAIGTDIIGLKIKLPENAEFIKLDIIDFNIDKTFDVIVSDVAPHTSGEHFIDAENSLEYCERALEIVRINLKKGGNFVCKILEGEGTSEFFQKIKKSFELAKIYKPKASRKESRETYIIGKNYAAN
jgi:23S rRNA (uridine2552-2'-O)-methyltransferase